MKYQSVLILATLFAASATKLNDHKDETEKFSFGSPYSIAEQQEHNKELERNIRIMEEDPRHIQENTLKAQQEFLANEAKISRRTALNEATKINSDNIEWNLDIIKPEHVQGRKYTIETSRAWKWP